MIRQLWGKTPQSIKEPLLKVRRAVEKEKVVFEATTPYSNIAVIDKYRCRYLVFDDREKGTRRQEAELIYQSCISLDGSADDRAAYASYFHLAWIFNAAIRDICMIGLGGGTVPRQFLRDYPDVYFTAVEIDPVVVQVAYRYFNLPRDDRLHVIVDDGRGYLDTCGKSFDLILLDAFFSRTIPYHLFTKEFFQRVSDCLSEEGLIGININSALQGPESYLCRCIYRTLHQVFPDIYLFAACKGYPGRIQNIIVFALKRPQKITAEEVENRAAWLAHSRIRMPHFTKQASCLYTEPLTDLLTVSILQDADAPASGMLNLYSS